MFECRGIGWGVDAIGVFARFGAYLLGIEARLMEGNLRQVRSIYR